MTLRLLIYKHYFNIEKQKITISMNPKLTKINSFSTLPLISSPTQQPKLMKRKSEADLNNSDDKEALSSYSKSTRTGELTYNGKQSHYSKRKKRVSK